MKKTSIFGIFAIVLLACVGFTACNNDVVETPEPETYTVTLGWSGEINVEYEPLSTRAVTDDLYGIQVYSAPISDSGNSAMVSWAPYAYGLFDGGANISINLLKDYKYKFVATMVRNGKNRLTEIGGDYIYPFSNAKHTNSFDYQSNKELFGLGSGQTLLIGNNAPVNIANVDRYYGELTDYIPNENNHNAKIDMKRTSFGAKFIAKGKLATEGTLQVIIGDAPVMELALTNSDNQIFDIFTFSKVYSAWANNDYSETISVVINWLRPDGKTQPLGTHNITYKRNATTVVNVNIENDVAPSGVGFDIADGEQGTPVEDEENEVTITDGEVVDTEVETN